MKTHGEAMKIISHLAEDSRQFSLEESKDVSQAIEVKKDQIEILMEEVCRLKMECGSS